MGRAVYLILSIELGTLAVGLDSEELGPCLNFCK